MYGLQDKIDELENSDNNKGKWIGSTSRTCKIYGTSKKTKLKRRRCIS
jgi:hypothetical protein